MPMPSSMLRFGCEVKAGIASNVSRRGSGEMRLRFFLSPSALRSLLRDFRSAKRSNPRIPRPPGISRINKIIGDDYALQIFYTLISNLGFYSEPQRRAMLNGQVIPVHSIRKNSLWVKGIHQVNTFHSGIEGVEIDEARTGKNSRMLKYCA